MNVEDIEQFLKNKASKDDQYIKIHFKKRDAIYGLFIKENDFNDLKSKNFWRIVTRPNFDAYEKSKNTGLAKIFCGLEFTRLTLYKDSFDND